MSVSTLAFARDCARESIRVVRSRTGKRPLARNLQWVWFMLSLCPPLYAANSSAAQERVLLQELMPELAGSPLASIDVAAAPALGSSLVLRKADVLRALARAGASAKGLEIPRTVHITRAVTSVPREQFSDEVRSMLEQAVAPCELREARFPSEVRLAGGPRSVRAEFPSGVRNGMISGTVVVESGGGNARVPVVANLVCPPPTVTAGMQVTALAVVGQVTASAPAEARQPGRVGEVIRITNRATGASLRARVLDSRTVEVVP